MQRPAPMTFGRWTSLALIPWAGGQAVFVALVGVALNLPIRTLLLPYLLLVWCGYVGVVLIYWARQLYDRPRSCAIRFALAIFFFLNLYMSVLLLSAVKVAILSAGSALNGYGPFILPGSALSAIAVYWRARRLLEGRKTA